MKILLQSVQAKLTKIMPSDLLSVKNSLLRHNREYWLLGILIFLYPAGMWLVPSLGSSVFNIIAFGGLVSIFYRRICPFDKRQAIVALCLIFYVFVTFFSWLINGQEELSTKLLNRHLLFLASIFAMFWLSELKPCAGFFWWGIVISSILIGLSSVIMLITYFYTEELIQVNSIDFRESIREVTQVNPIVYGQIATFFTALCPVSFPYFFRIKPWVIIFPLLGTLLGLIAVVGSLTRGAWIALPIIFILHCFYYSRVIFKQFFKFVVVMIALGICLYILSGWPLVEERISLASEEVKAYLEGPQNRDTAVGSRLDMWKAAWSSGMSSFLFGPGKDGYQREIHLRVESGEFSPDSWVAMQHFPHSEYFSAFGYHGVSGLIALIVLLGGPGLIFLRSLIKENDNSSKELDMAGLILVVSFAFFGLTDSPFEQRTTIIFFSLILVVILSSVNISGDNKSFKDSKG